jgi:hypothetical protein
MLNKQLRFCATDQAAISQISLTLRALMAEKVTARRFAMCGFARRRNLEAAFHSLMCLLLWHFFLRDIH